MRLGTVIFSRTARSDIRLSSTLTAATMPPSASMVGAGAGTGSRSARSPSTCSAIAFRAFSRASARVSPADKAARQIGHGHAERPVQAVVMHDGQVSHVYGRAVTVSAAAGTSFSSAGPFSRLTAAIS